MQISERSKKIIIAALFLVLAAAFGAGIYLLFFRPLFIGIGPTGTTTPPLPGGLPVSGPGSGQIAPDAGDGGLPQPAEVPLPPETASPVALGGLTAAKRLGDSPVLGAKLSADSGRINYYNPGDNKFYRLDPSGRAEALSGQEFYNVENVVWSNVSDRAVIEYPDGSNIVYDFASQKQASLPAHWDDFSFAQGQDTLSMKIIGLDPENRYLAVSAYDGSGVKPIEPIGLNAGKVTPSWGNNDQVVALYAEGTGFERQEIFFVGQNRENFKSIVVEGRGFEHLWSPGGDRLLYSVYTSDNGLRPSLWTVDASGDSAGLGRKNLNLDTWAGKCAYHSDTAIYCAVPAYLPEGAGFMPELSAGIPDNLYEIDPVSGAKKLIAVPDGDFRMQDLMVDKDGRYLYFVDQSTKSLHQVRLK